jgi:penicillin-binding protein 1A
VQGYRYIAKLEAGLPDVAEVESYARDGTMTIKAGDGSVLQYIGPATRDEIAYDNMPDNLRNAFIASEDRRFYQHKGIDMQAIARAAYANLQEREVVEGASTITQQLARIVFLDQEQTYERKLREALLARKIERQLNKSEVLERYLNLVYLGSGAYGVADAAWVYFSKKVEDLTLAETAMIAGMAPAPSVYSPLVEPDAALSRRNVVLRRMQVAGKITEAEAEAAIAAPLDLNPSSPKNLYSEFPYFTSYVQQRLNEILSPEEIERGGLTVDTTLNVEWQRRAEETVQEAVARWGPGQRFEQAALAAVDPRTGEIKALVGGTEFGETQFNRATQAQRQPGSTFKAFVYTTAIAAGFSPYQSYADAKYVVDGYEPQNYGGGYSGNVSIRRALTSSINIVAVKVLVDVGFQPVIDMAQAMGIESELLSTYSLALGASEVNLLELTSAYGTLANEGMHHRSRAILRITNRYGDVIYDASDLKPQRAVDAETAAIVTWMLEGVVQGGTGSNAAIGRPVAGKTGTSERDRDLWFVGYIPQLVVGVWLGNDDSSPTWGASSTAASTWRLFMRDTVEGMEEEDFPDLPDLNREGTIEAQPVEPGSVTASRASSRADDDDGGSSSRRSYSSYDRDSASGSSGSSSGSSSRRSSSYESAPAPSSRRSQPAPAKTPAPARNEPKNPPPAAPAPPVSDSGSSQAPAPPPAPAPAPPPPAPAPAPPPPAPAAVEPPPAPAPAPAPVAPPPAPAPAAPPPPVSEPAAPPPPAPE